MENKFFPKFLEIHAAGLYFVIFVENSADMRIFQVSLQSTT